MVVPFVKALPKMLWKENDETENADMMKELQCLMWMERGSMESHLTDLADHKSLKGQVMVGDHAPVM